MIRNQNRLSNAIDGIPHSSYDIIASKINISPTAIRGNAHMSTRSNHCKQRSVQTGSYLRYTLQCSVPVVIAMRKSVRGWCRCGGSPFRMQREPAPWPSPASSQLPLACPFALWMRQSLAYRPLAEKLSRCFVHTERPPRQHYHQPGRWRRSKRKEEDNFNVNCSFNQLSKWAQWQTHSCKANGKWQIRNYINIAIAIRIECISIAQVQLTAFNALAISDAVFLYVLVR